jgi:hypothetical protein
LEEWKQMVGGNITASEGNAFIDGYLAGVAKR